MWHIRCVDVFGFENFFKPGTPLYIVGGSYNGHDFGGEADLVQSDAAAVELFVHARRWWIKVDLRLRFALDPMGRWSFLGGREDPDNTQKIQHELELKESRGTIALFRDVQTNKDVNVE